LNVYQQFTTFGTLEHSPEVSLEHRFGEMRAEVQGSTFVLFSRQCCEHWHFFSNLANGSQHWLTFVLNRTFRPIYPALSPSRKPLGASLKNDFGRIENLIGERNFNGN